MQQEKLSYSKIQDVVDKLIYKLGGSENVVKLLESMLKSMSESINDTDDQAHEKHAYIMLHITLYVCSEFGLTLQELIHGANSYSVYRGAVFYFHQKYASNVSIRSVCDQFGKKQPAYYNGIKVISNVIESRMPKAILTKIIAIENKILKLIKK